MQHTYIEPPSNLSRLTEQVIGAAIEVHKELGPGYLESTYENALAIELQMRHLACQTQYPITLEYKGYNIGTGRIDLLIEENLIVELKAVEKLLPVHQAQVISYLKVMGKPLGLLINFNVPILRDGIKRIVLSK